MRRLIRLQKQLVSHKLLIIDELGFVPLSKTRRGTPVRTYLPTLRTRRHADHQQPAVRRMDRDVRHRAPHRRAARPADRPRPHSRDERRKLPTWPEPRPKSRRQHLITPRRFGAAGLSAMACASYVASARAMALSPAPLAWFCTAHWPDFTPPLTARQDRSAQTNHRRKQGGHMPRNPWPHQIGTGGQIRSE